LRVVLVFLHVAFFASMKDTHPAGICRELWIGGPAVGMAGFCFLFYRQT